MRGKFLSLIFLSIVFLVSLTSSISANASLINSHVFPKSGEFWIDLKGNFYDANGTLMVNQFERFKRDVASAVQREYSAHFSTDGVYPSAIKLNYPKFYIAKNGSSDKELMTSRISFTDFDQNANSSTFYVELSNASSFKLHIPKKVDSNSTGFIFTAVNRVNDIFDSSKRAVLDLTLGDSINLYSFYPEQQVYLTDLVDFSTGKIKSNARMKYSLDQLMHPLFGTLEPSEAVAKDLTSVTKFDDVSFEYDDDGVLAIVPHPDYLNFVNNTDGSLERFTDLDTSKVSTSTGIKEYQSTLLSKVFKLMNKVDSTLRVALPTVYSQKGRGSNPTYDMSDTDGYVIMEDIRLGVTTNLAYLKKNGVFESGVDFKTYDIDNKTLVVTKVQLNGSEVGAIVPTRYREAVYVGSRGDEVYFTGRDFLLRGKYKTGISLSTVNQNLFALMTPSGETSANLRLYAFPSSASPFDLGTHLPLENAPSSFELKTDFYVNTEGFGGFTIFINNINIKDAELMNWLSSDASKAIAGVKSEELLKVINGSLESETESKFTLEEWYAMQDIKVELENQSRGTISYIIVLACVVIGIFFIVYGIFLVLAYWLDMLNVLSTLLNISAMGLLTAGRLEANPDTLGIMNLKMQSVEGKRYVNLIHVLILMVICVLVGVFFLNFTDVVMFIIGLYNTVVGWFS